MHVLVTGGAGSVGANLCAALACRHPEWRIAALDDLRRRGGELNLTRMREAGVELIHGDVRTPEALVLPESFDAIVECSAEPSVTADIEGSPDYAVQSNLVS